MKEEEEKEKKEAKEENEVHKVAVTLTENVLCENSNENRSSGIGDDSFDQSEQDNNTYLKKGPEKNPAVEAKIEELYSVLLQSGDEERIRDFQKFMLNKQRI